MGKILDYLNWRGDLSFAKDPFNDIDALILALISYLPFKDIIPRIDTKKEISLKNAALQFFSIFPITEKKSIAINSTASPSFNYEVAELFKKAASCPRFEGINMSGYEENVDFVVGRQFAAVLFNLHYPEHKKEVAFRGTDSSVMGWKEDFELAYMEQIPAQESACKYLERTIGIFSSQFIVCGHSKGGNLALYAGSHVNAARQSRITKIINFDGPGFDFSVVQKGLFSHCEHKIWNYIPEDSMVGLLLESVGKRVVVSSSDRLLKQHDAFNWEMERSEFVHGSLSTAAILLEQTLKTWLTEISIPKREMFLEALFEVLGASEGKKIKVRSSREFKGN